MIANPTIGLIAVFMEAIGIIIAEKRSALLLSIAAILTIIILFMV
jgi:hypothetical protein